jgi:hypothetical protein
MRTIRLHIHLAAAALGIVAPLGASQAGPVLVDTVVLTGQTAPGTAAGVSFSDLRRPTVNDNGDVVFRSTVQGSGVDTTNDTGIWLRRNGTLGIVARENGATPLGGGLSFGSMIIEPNLNDSGDVGRVPERAPWQRRHHWDRHRALATFIRWHHAAGARGQCGARRRRGRAVR